MKKNLILLIVAISTGFFVGCDLETDHTPPNYVSFEATSLGFNVHETATDSYEVTVYTGNITGNDRTFDINVEGASTLDPAIYTIPSSVTVPANTNEATFNVEVTGAGISNTGNTLVLSLGQEEGLFTGNNLTLNVGKICDFDLTGTLTNASGWYGEEYPVEIEAGASANQYVVKDMFADGTDITFTVNEDLTISIPNQPAWVHASYGQASVTGRAGSKVEPCLATITLVMEHTVAAGTFGTETEVLTVPGEEPEGEEGEGEEGEGEEAEGEEAEGEEAEGEEGEGEEGEGEEGEGEEGDEDDEDDDTEG